MDNDSDGEAKEGDEEDDEVTCAASGGGEVSAAASPETFRGMVFWKRRARRLSQPGRGFAAGAAAPLRFGFEVAAAAAAAPAALSILSFGGGGG
jgi:hypothetical protein